MKQLFDETYLTGTKLKNRFFRSATYEKMADENGFLTPELFELYKDLSDGGTGTIITSVNYITDDSRSLPGQLGISTNRHAELYRPLLEYAHSKGTRMILQFSYASRNGSFLKVSDPTEAELITIAKDFGKAAARAEAAGFDGVQIHSAHEYFLCSFLHPETNARTDSFGGSQENMARLVTLIYDEIRENTSKSFLVTVKLNAVNQNETEEKFRMCRYVCKKLDERGIDAIEISGFPSGVDPTGKKIEKYKESILRDYAAEIAAEINAPVILVNKNRDLNTMTDVLNSTDIEYFSMSRPFLREPAIVNKWSVKPDERSICISCNKCFGETVNRCVFV